MFNILIINGPNLNLLGEREKDKYGNTSIDQIKKNCLSFSKQHNINLSFFQSNVEGEIVNEIQNARNNQNCFSTRIEIADYIEHGSFVNRIKLTEGFV